MIHRIWQTHNVMPGTIYSLDRSQKVFLYASEEIVIEEELEAQRERERRQKATKK